MSFVWGGAHFFCEIRAKARIFRGLKVFCYTGTRYPQDQVPPWSGTSYRPATPPRIRYTARRTRYPPEPGTPQHQVLHPDQVHPHGTRYTMPRTRYTHWDQVCPRSGTLPWEDKPSRSTACWEIRATSGWYASYWNAFLFKLKCMQNFVLEYLPDSGVNQVE